MPYGTPPRLKKLNIRLPLIDLHFLDCCAKQQGISKGEFMRRIIAEARMGWMKHGLYRMPDEREQRGLNGERRAGLHQGEQ